MYSYFKNNFDNQNYKSQYFPNVYQQCSCDILPNKCKNFPDCKSKCKKFSLKNLKKDTCKSLNEVEYFLNNFNNHYKYLKLIKLLK